MKVNMFISCLICEIWIFIDDFRVVHHKLGVFVMYLWSCVELFEEMRKGSAALAVRLLGVLQKCKTRLWWKIRLFLHIPPQILCVIAPLHAGWECLRPLIRF